MARFEFYSSPKKTIWRNQNSARICLPIAGVRSIFVVDLSFLAMIGILLNFVGCNGNNSNASIEFQKFVNTHQLLHSPPSHSFRMVDLDRSQPKKVHLYCGECDGFSGVFKVAVQIDRPNFDGGATSSDFRSLATELASLKEWENFDWINGRNAQYGFGVRPSVEGFTLNGIQESSKEVVTNSFLSCALVFAKCFIRDAEDKFEIVEFLPSQAQLFPNSVALRMVHRRENYSVTVFLDRDQGRCLGYEGFDANGKITSRTVHHYRIQGSDAIPLAQDCYRQDKQGQLELGRSTVFLDWKSSKGPSKKQCYVSYYGFPEPEFVRQSFWYWLAWGAGSFAIISLGFIVRQQIRKRR